MTASIQTSFTQYLLTGVPGELYDNSDYLARSYAAETDIDFGKACVAGTDVDRQVKIPSATGQVFRGVAKSIYTVEQNLVTPPVTSKGLYLINKEVAVISRGTIWVRVNVDVDTDDPVYFVYDNVDPTLIGNFRNDAGTSEADLVPAAKFLKGALAGELAVIELNLP